MINPTKFRIFANINYLDSMSKIKPNEIKINGLDIELPDVPEKNKILGYKKKKENQKWERTPLPEGWDLLSVKDKATFVKQEFERRRDGVWFMNNGAPTYITGNHYFYLNWCKIDIGYPDYRDRDRRFFTFWDACKKDGNSFGMVMVKHRREGASWKGACMALYEITSAYNAHGGLLSKTGQDAKELFQKVVYMFRNLPEFFQPIIDGTDNPKSALSFNTPGHRITKQHKKVQKSEALNSKIDWRNTRENSYDSTKLKYFMCDEAGKWEEASVVRNWQIVKPTMSLGNKVIGKCFMPSTVNEMTRGGGANFKEIWNGSDPENRNANGSTESGLYKYFTPAYDGLEGFIDEYGVSDIEGGKQYLDNIREGLKNDTSKLSEHKRQFPYTPDEAFRNETKSCAFDVEKIYSQVDWLDSLVRPMTVKGNFIWRGNQRDGHVVWMPDRNGRWEVSWMPDDSETNMKVNRGGRWAPANEATIVSGVDPYDHQTTTDGKKSNAAAYVFRKYNPAMANETHCFVSEYINRPPTVQMFYEDMLMQCIFYGCQILVENNKVGLINYFEERGYGRYLMERPEVTHTEYSRKQKIKGIPTSGEVVVNSIIDAIQIYVYEAIGYDQHTGEIGRCYFKELLLDWVNFEPDNRRKYDATMASGITLLAAQKYVKQKKEYKPVQFVKKYNNAGMLSKIIKT